MWNCCFDDVLMLWTGTCDSRAEFMLDLGKNAYNLKFTMHQDLHQISFLDITIMIQEDGGISTTLQRKETAVNTLLHVTRFRPAPLLSSIPYGQYLRLRRICSDDYMCKHEADILSERSLICGYSTTLLKKAFKRASKQTRQQALFKRSNENNEAMPGVIMTYKRQHPCIRGILQKHWYLLTNDSILKKYTGDQILRSDE